MSKTQLELWDEYVTQQQKESTITLSIENNTNNTPNHTETLPALYVDQESSLKIILTNKIDGDITLSKASSMDIYLPQYFESSEVQAVTASNLPAGWTFSSNTQDLKLTYTQDSGTWKSGKHLVFILNNVKCSHSPTSGSLQVNFNELTGSNIPLQVEQHLPLMKAPKQGNLSLKDVLSVQLDSSNNTVCISDENDAVLLSNTLRLVLTNISSDPISTDCSGSFPTVTVSFVYGSTPGSLAPKTPEDDSAWNIQASIEESMGNDWSVKNPVPWDDKGYPSWVFSPTETNQNIIGTGDKASIVFDLSHIISKTPVGVTLMYVHFSGFPKYNDKIFILPIAKHTIANRGLIDLGLDRTYVTPNREKDVLLNWNMSDVRSVKLTFTDQTTFNQQEVKIPPYSRIQPLLQLGQYKWQVPGDIKDSTDINITLTAYSDTEYKNIINQKQCKLSVYIPEIVSFKGTVDLNANTVKLSWWITGFPSDYSLQGSWTHADLPLEEGGAGTAIETFGPTRFTLSILDPNGSVVTSRTIGYDYQPSGSPINIGSLANDIVITPDERYALVCSNSQNYHVSVVDLKTKSPLKDLEVQVYPKKIHIIPDQKVAVLNGEKISLEDFTITSQSYPDLSKIKGVPFAQYLCYYICDNYWCVWALSLTDQNFCIMLLNEKDYVHNEITKITEHDFFNTTQEVYIAPCMMNDKLCLVVNANEIFIIQVESPFKEIAQISLKDNITSIAITPDSTTAFVTHETVGYVSVIDLVSYKEIKQISIGASSNDVAISGDGNTAIIAHKSDTCLSVINVKNLSMPHFISLEDTARKIAISRDGTTIILGRSNHQDLIILHPNEKLIPI